MELRKALSDYTERQFEQFVQEMNQGGLGHGHARRKEQGEGGQENGAQAESGEQAQKRRGQGRQAHDEKLHGDLGTTGMVQGVRRLLAEGAPGDKGRALFLRRSKATRRSIVARARADDRRRGTARDGRRRSRAPRARREDGRRWRPSQSTAKNGSMTTSGRSPSARRRRKGRRARTRPAS